MIYRARTENNKLFMAMYETEEPKKDHYGQDFEYLEALKQWQSSKREYKVRKEDEQAIKQELLGEVPFMLSDIETELEKGIDCTFLKDRLKLECTGCGWDYNKPIGPTHLACCPDNRYQWTLLPLEDKKENETETMFREVVSVFHKWNRGDTDKYWLDELKQKFTITRKPNIQEPE